jgi:calcineurin-like phosphoesterase
MQAREQAQVVLVDFHAEATSEKIALAGCSTAA